MEPTDDTFQHEMLMLVFRMGIALACVSVKAETPAETENHWAAHESEAQRLEASPVLIASKLPFIAQMNYTVVLPSDLGNVTWRSGRWNCNPGKHDVLAKEKGRTRKDSPFSHGPQATAAKALGASA